VGKNFRAATPTETWSGAMHENWGQLAVLEAQRAETCPDLEVRTGSSAEGCTTQDCSL